MTSYEVSVVLDSTSQTLAAEPDTTDGDGLMPAELRRWLVSLRLLQAVPFAYLVPDTDLLPEESIRWFYLDRRWTDALVQGALSVGTVNSDDRTQLSAQYAAVRAELDKEERQVRRGPDAARLEGDGGPISGFLLRSRAVSGWPAIHVRAFSVDPGEDEAPYDEDDERRLRLLRLERLAPAVLLCLFDGIPEVVHLEEPRQGVQFGFKTQGSDTTVTAQMKPRKKDTFEYIDNVDPITVPFRTGASGVVDIKELENRLRTTKTADGKSLGELTGANVTGTDAGLDSAEYALQLVQMPWRQVWGEDTEPTVADVFTPKISYQKLSTTFLEATS